MSNSLFHPGILRAIASFYSKWQSFSNRLFSSDLDFYIIFDWTLYVEMCIEENRCTRRLGYGKCSTIF